MADLVMTKVIPMAGVVEAISAAGILREEVGIRVVDIPEAGAEEAIRVERLRLKYRRQTSLHRLWTTLGTMAATISPSEVFLANRLRFSLLVLSPRVKFWA